jgi:Mg-chelatase subunit ChlD
MAVWKTVPWRVAAAAVLLLPASACGALGGEEPAGCAAPVLRVVAAPEIAPAVSEAAQTLGGCTRVEVGSGDPSGADVWIPDSSRWLDSVPGAGAEAVSIASTPVGLAVRARLARGLGPRPTYDDLVGALPATATLGAADPASSAATQAALTDLRTALGSTAELRGRAGALMRGLRVQPAGLATAADVQVASEQQVAAANAAAGRRAFVAVRPAEAGLSLDYPFVVTSFDIAGADVAARLRDRLTSAAGRARLRQLGFRTGAPGVRPLTEEVAEGTLAALAELARPIRILAVVDVSGSMSRPVPGADGSTRMDLARQALREGMRLFPDHTVAGLWRFSANLTPSSDYEQIVPLTEMTAANRSRVAAATDRLTVDPHGGTGLYATTLAAVRAVRAGYDESRVNSVVVLSDGRDEKAAAHHVELETLVATLKAETDPSRPVIVNMIAYGPDSDAGSMQQVASATGGSVYAVRDPRQLPEVFRDAIGNRLCDGAC